MFISLLFILFIFFIAVAIKSASSNKEQFYNDDYIDKSFTEDQDYYSSTPEYEISQPDNLCQNGRCAKTYIDENGYRRFIDSDKQVSRWVAEKFVVRRKLYCEEVVHHIDGNKLNNRPNNLMVFMNQEAHLRHHQNNYRYSGDWHSFIPEY